MQRYFKTVNANNSNILLWKSKGFSDESIEPPTTSSKMLNHSVDPTLRNCLFGVIKLTKMLMLICINIKDMVSDFIEKDLIQLVMKLVEM